MKIHLARGEQYIENIALLDQWSMTIENHWSQWLKDPKTIEKTIETNGLGAGYHLMVMVEWPQNHRKTIESNGQWAEKHYMALVSTKNAYIQWFPSDNLPRSTHVCMLWAIVKFSLKAMVALDITWHIFLILLLSVKVVTAVFYAH